MLEIQPLIQRYGTGDVALRGVDLSLADGEVVGLIGASGAGKSTLIRCINRLVEPTSGSIRMAGVELTDLPGGKLRKQRRRIGMIFQEYALVERISVMENALSGRLGYDGLFRAAVDASVCAIWVAVTKARMDALRLINNGNKIKPSFSLVWSI